MAHNPFEPWASNGFLADLLPIIPPTGELSPFSFVKSSQRGKLPGRVTADGLWAGLVNWTPQIATRDQIATWTQGRACNVGLNARTLHAFDVDTTDPAFARAAYDTMLALIPDAVAAVGLRFGRAPGFLVPFKPETPHRKARLVFMKDDAKSAIEQLGVGQQYVIAGQHPTGKPYTWKAIKGGMILPTRRLADLPTIPDAMLADIWQAYVARMESQGWTLQTRSAIRQHTGNGHSELSDDLPEINEVERALECLPNRPENKRDREEWISFLHAIAGATGKSEDGRALWLRWSAQWDDSIDATDDANSRWDTLNGSDIGWPWLHERACGASEDYRLAFAVETFEQIEEDEALNGHAVTADLFDTPHKEIPTQFEIEEAIEALQPKDVTALADLLRAIAKTYKNAVWALHDDWLKTIKVKFKSSVPVLRKMLYDYVKAGEKNADDVGNRMALVTLDKFGVDRLACQDGEFFSYDGVMWGKVQAEKIGALINQQINDNEALLMQSTGRKLHHSAAVDQALKILRWQTSNVLAPLNDPAFMARQHLKINCRNGCVTLARNGAVTFREGHDPRDCFTWILDIDYDPLASGVAYDNAVRDLLGATCHTLTVDDPDLLKFKTAVDRVNASPHKPLTLADGRLIWRDGSDFRMVDLNDNARLINEVLGYGLIADRMARLAVILQGPGSNGKSSLVRCYSSRMKGGMAVSMSIDDLQASFGMVELERARVLALDEGKGEYVKDDVMKRLTENRTDKVNRKGRDYKAVDLHPLAIINMNNWLRSTDHSKGFRDRFLIVPLLRDYSKADRLADPWPDIMASDAEMSAALNRWLEGATAVLQRRYIQTTKAADQFHDLWEQNNSPERRFVALMCMTQKPDKGKTEGDSVNKLWLSYCQWFGAENQWKGRPSWSQKFEDVLTGFGFEVYKANKERRVRGLWVDPAKMDNTGSTFGMIEDD